LISRKIVRIIATRSDIIRLKLTKLSSRRKSVSMTVRLLDGVWHLLNQGLLLDDDMWSPQKWTATYRQHRHRRPRQQWHRSRGRGSVAVPSSTRNEGTFGRRRRRSISRRWPTELVRRHDTWLRTVWRLQLTVHMPRSSDHTPTPASTRCPPIDEPRRYKRSKHYV